MSIPQISRGIFPGIFLICPWLVLGFDSGLSTTINVLVLLLACMGVGFAAIRVLNLMPDRPVSRTLFSTPLGFILLCAPMALLTHSALGADLYFWAILIEGGGEASTVLRMTWVTGSASLLLFGIYVVSKRWVGFKWVMTVITLGFTSLGFLTSAAGWYNERATDPTSPAQLPARLVGESARHAWDNRL